MLDQRADKEVQCNHLRGWHFRPGAYAARTRHRRCLRATEDRRRAQAPEPRSGLSMLSPLRRALVREVRAAFNDERRGERPVAASHQALFPHGSVIRRVHGDVTSMMVGGIAALLTQMLHPKALAGVWDHSDVAENQVDRLRRTARFIAVTTYGHRALTLAAIESVRSIHDGVSVTLPQAAHYQ